MHNFFLLDESNVTWKSPRKVFWGLLWHTREALSALWRNGEDKITQAIAQIKWKNFLIFQKYIYKKSRLLYFLLSFLLTARAESEEKIFTTFFFLFAFSTHTFLSFGLFQYFHYLISTTLRTRIKALLCFAMLEIRLD